MCIIYIAIVSMNDKSAVQYGHYTYLPLFTSFIILALITATSILAFYSTTMMNHRKLDTHNIGARTKPVSLQRILYQLATVRIVYLVSSQAWNNK